MAPVYTQNEALNALFEQIMNVHWNFLETDESMQKIKLRQDLEGEWKTESIIYLSTNWVNNYHLVKKND